MSKQTPVLILLLMIMCLPACQQADVPTPTATPYSSVPVTESVDNDSFIGQPNPASFYCEEMGYDLQLRDEAEGTVGICVLPDGSECEEWEFLAGRCGKEYSYCERQGYALEAGEEVATCNFPDGSSCPEYELFIGECSPPE